MLGKRQALTGSELKKPFGGVFVANEKFELDTAEKVLATQEADAVTFDVLFIANPDLPRRFALHALLNEADQSTFYMSGL